jgi:hypothetical protein
MTTLTDPRLYSTAWKTAHSHQFANKDLVNGFVKELSGLDVSKLELFRIDSNLTDTILKGLHYLIKQSAEHVYKDMAIQFTGVIDMHLTRI